MMVMVFQSSWAAWGPAVPSASLRPNGVVRFCWKHKNVFIFTGQTLHESKVNGCGRSVDRADSNVDWMIGGRHKLVGLALC